MTGDKEYMLSISLDAMTGIFEAWRAWDTLMYTKEGRSPPGDEKHIMCPPHWPSHGQLKIWVEVLQQAKQCLAGKTSSTNTASPTATEAGTSREET